MCCKLKPDISSYWYDLGICFICQHQFWDKVPKVLSTPDRCDQMSFLLNAKDCFITSVNLDSENYNAWNILGILYSNNGKELINNLFKIYR